MATFADTKTKRWCHLGEAELRSRLVGVQFILVREFFVLEELVLLGQEFLKRRSFVEARCEAALGLAER